LKKEKQIWTINKLISKDKNYEKYKGRNLHVKNLDEDVTEAELLTTFSKFGTVTSVKIEKDDQNQSKCFGYVCFNTTEEAKKAVDEMNGGILDGRGKPIHVGFFQTKEERKMYLDQQHQMNAMRPQIPYPIYIQSPQVQGSVPPPQYMARQQQQQYIQVPTMRSPYMPSPVNSIPRGQRIAGPRPTSGSYVPANSRPRSREQQPVVPVPRPTQGQAPERFISDLTKATAEEQKHMLGEKLFPLVYKERPADAAKITGMILELDVSELLNFLESADLLKSKVQEAVQVLEKYNATSTQ